MSIYPCRYPFSHGRERGNKKIKVFEINFYISKSCKTNNLIILTNY